MKKKQTQISTSRWFKGTVAGLILLVASGVIGCHLLIRQHASKEQKAQARHSVQNTSQQQPVCFYKVDVPSPAINAKAPSSQIDQYGSAPSKTGAVTLAAVLQRHYQGHEYAVERLAYKRVLRWQSAVDRIIAGYPRLDRHVLLAIIKAESQGVTGELVSSRQAVGLTQIKYQGAWSFLWDALFRDYVDIDSRTRRDYYNRNIRHRYGAQLERIRQHLHRNKLLVVPPPADTRGYRQARWQSWKRLKTYLKRKFQPGEYQVAIDIAAMYLDHLHFLFTDYRQKITAIRRHLIENPATDIDRLRFTDTQQTVWLRLRERIEDELVTNFFHLYALDLTHTESRAVKAILWTKIKQNLTDRVGLNVRDHVAAKLERIEQRIQNPQVWFAGYNIGPSIALDCVEKDVALPADAMRYAGRVSKFIEVFNQLNPHHRRHKDAPHVAGTPDRAPEIQGQG